MNILSKEQELKLHASLIKATLKCYAVKAYFENSSIKYPSRHNLRPNPLIKQNTQYV